MIDLSCFSVVVFSERQLIMVSLCRGSVWLVYMGGLRLEGRVGCNNQVPAQGEHGPTEQAGAEQRTGETDEHLGGSLQASPLGLGESLEALPREDPQTDPPGLENYLLEAEFHGYELESMRVDKTVMAVQPVHCSLELLHEAACQEFRDWRALCVQLAQRSPEMRSILEGASSGTARTLAGTCKIALCSTNLKRVWQSQRALPLQLMALWPFALQDRVRLYLTDFNEDDQLQDFVFSNCAMAMQVGLLHYSRLPRKYWHCSECKNTSHWQAYDWADVVGNIDCDRLFPSELISLVATTFCCDPDANQWRVVHAGGHASTCGTVFTFAASFFELGGYDEEDTGPTGAQDVDLVLRFKEAGRQAGCIQLYRFQDVNVVGCAIPNDSESQITSMWKDHIKAKVANLAPEFAGMKWGNINQKNYTLMTERRKRGILKRNNRPGWQPQMATPVLLEALPRFAASESAPRVQPAQPIQPSPVLEVLPRMPSAASASSPREQPAQPTQPLPFPIGLPAPHLQVVITGWGWAVLHESFNLTTPLTGMPGRPELKELFRSNFYEQDLFWNACPHSDSRFVGTEDLARHLGFHPATMQQVLRNHVFRSTLQELKKHLQRFAARAPWLPPSSQVFWLAVGCKWNRHRSPIHHNNSCCFVCVPEYHQTSIPYAVVIPPTPVYIKVCP
jgi:hypothetical protein